ncbi:glycosyltransferase family 4 protein [Methylobacterium sp. J-026]|uniref:glycosyltransferase family 4 protein n=1 Tax=Methylobacterium sp. J-026 TaxID=2836624 RepID=UPI001FBA4907|nr:glycosyltransferase family 1 protein [Methylobacterium sp. J-026]MCJ2133391.1 glycosyltransferase family 4 protein [Methylobacterium sp. J-026]
MRLTIRPLHDLQRDGDWWLATGDDPQLLLARPFGRRIAAGRYRLTAEPGTGLEEAAGAELYADTGQGFRAEECQPIRFDWRDGETTAVIVLDRPVRRLRLDPFERAGPRFRLRRVTLQADLAEVRTARAEDRTAQAPLPHRRLRVALNLVRLLPENRGSGGAGRLALALLAHLPRRVELRAAIPPYWTDLIARFPEVGFSVVQSDNNVDLRQLIAWCECYVDPLNGLRPTTIDPRVAVISLVLDLQHLRMPWLFAQADMKSRVAEYSYAIDRSDRLVAISAYERDNLTAFYGADRITVAHLAGFMAEDSGLSEDEARNRRAGIGEGDPYLVYPAVPWPHKNHEILVQAVAVLARRGVRIPLVLTNTASRPAARDRLAQVAAALGVGDSVDLRPFMSESELLDLVTRARGLVFPSLYEGFGIPLVDAMALGVPVLTTRTSAVPEICGDAVAYFATAANAVAMADDLERFWTDAEGRRHLAAKGFVQARHFSSAAMVGKLAEAIEAAVFAKASAPGGLPVPSRFSPPRYAGLAVFVIYADLTPADRAALREAGDIDALHAAAFGGEADVTVGLEIGLVDDPDLRALFARTRKLICFDPAQSSSREAAVEDFSLRYDHREFQLITAFRDGRPGFHGAAAVESAVMALRLFGDADYAEFDPRIQDCAVDAVPDEGAGVLAYDERRRDGLVVADAILRRSSADDRRNGTVPFLSRFCTGYRRLRVPIPRV